MAADPVPPIVDDQVVGLSEADQHRAAAAKIDLERYCAQRKVQIERNVREQILNDKKALWSGIIITRGAGPVLDPEHSPSAADVFAYAKKALAEYEATFRLEIEQLAQEQADALDGMGARTVMGIPPGARTVMGIPPAFPGPFGR